MGRTEERRIKSVEGSIAGVETAGVSFWMDKLESSAQACRRRYLLKAEIENVIESNRRHVMCVTPQPAGVPRQSGGFFFFK